MKKQRRVPYGHPPRPDAPFGRVRRTASGGFAALADAWYLSPFSDRPQSPSSKSDAVSQQFVGPKRIFVVGDDVLNHHLVGADAVGQLRQ